MRRVVLGVIGHVDHGKTALVRALTGMDTDRLPEEKRRGISIALGFAHGRIAGAEVDFIDMPGHERFVRTMVSGATGLDAALLVVAANEGVAPQTVEHVDIAGLLGLARAVIAITKADLASPDDVARIGQEALALARGAGLEASAPVPVSAVTGRGLDELRGAIAALSVEPGERGDDGFFYLPVDRAFSLPGHGTVVTGTLRRGALARASGEAALFPTDRPVRIRRLQVHGADVPSAEPGQRVAANLRGIKPGEIPRGAALVTGGLLEATSWLSVELRSVPGAPTLRTSQRLQLLHGTAEVDVRLRLLDLDEIKPNQTALAQLKALEPVALPTRESFVLRLPSPARTVAGGRVLDTASVRVRRGASGALARLATLARSDPAGILMDELERAGLRGAPVEMLARLAGLGLARAMDMLGQLPTVTDRRRLVVAQAAFDFLLERVQAVIAEQTTGRDGLSREQLHALLPEAGASLIDEAALRLVAKDVLRQQGGHYRIARPALDRARATQDAAASARLAEKFRQAGLTPPNVLQDPGTRPLVDRLVRQGTLVRTLDRVQKREIVFHQDAVETAKKRLVPLLAGGSGLLVTEIGAALGISRRYSVPLLEHLDMVRFTRRVADRRVLVQSP